MIGVVDIGGTKIAAGVVDDAGRLHGRREEPTLPQDGFARALDRIADMVRGAARVAALSGGDARLDGVAVGTTGPFDRARGIFGPVDLLPGWEGEDLVAALRARLGVTDVVVENDADAAALGEATFGAGRGHRHFVYVTVSTGVGAGVVIDGRIVRGPGGVHPEVGHHVLEASGPACACGARGCWEALVSGPAMVAWARAQGAPDRADLTAEAICLAAAAGEPWAEAVLAREARYLGIGLANLITILAPDVIALGGGVIRSAHLFLDRVRAVVDENAKLVPRGTTRIELAANADDAVLLGAAQALFEARGARSR